MRGELDWIVMKALEKDRNRRYETANDFAADVMRYLTDEPVEACPPSAGYRLRKFVRRNKGPVAAGLALAVLLVLGTVGTSIGLVWALRAERKATLPPTSRTAEGWPRIACSRSPGRRSARAPPRQGEGEAAVAEAVIDFLQNDLLAQADAGQERPRQEGDRGRSAGACGRSHRRQVRPAAAGRGEDPA